MAAAQDTTTTFPADRCVIFSQSAGEQRYREEIDEAELREQFGVTVDQALISAG
jgi:hypothetical protein